VHGDFSIPVRAMQDPAEFGIADYILFCVKAYDSEAAAQQVRACLGPESAVVSLQNGVNAVERLDPLLGEGRVLPGAVYVDASIAAPGVIEQRSAFRRVLLGEVRGPVSSRVQRVADALERSGAEVERRDDMRAALWEKYHYICALSGMTGATRASVGAILSCQDTRELFGDAVREVYAVCRAEGVHLDAGIVNKTIERALQAKPETKSSLLYDLEHNKPLEIEILSGYLVERAKELGVPTPVHRVLAASLRLADSLNRSGKH
jgi:2-dehydropantoate 2-reductase